MYQEKIIADYPAYKVTTDGRVLTCFKPKTSIISDDWRELKQIYDKTCGYMIVTLCKGKNQGRQNKRVHRLIMEAFVPNPNNYPQINHIDGNKLNNSLENLEWCSSKHNTQHAIRLGLHNPKQQPHNRAVIQMDNDYNYIAEFTSLHEASSMTGVAWQNIYKVCRGLRPRAGNFRWKYK